MSGEGKREERTDIEGELVRGELYRAVVDTERALRSSYDYNALDARDRQVAVLCHAIECSAYGASGTSVNLYGILTALNTLQSRAKAGR